MWAKVLPTVSRIVSQAQLEVNELEDMQWKFGVTAASDEMRRVGSTFLQVDTHCNDLVTTLFRERNNFGCFVCSVEVDRRKGRIKAEGKFGDDAPAVL